MFQTKSLLSEISTPAILVASGLKSKSHSGPFGSGCQVLADQPDWIGGASFICHWLATDCAIGCFSSNAEFVVISEVKNICCEETIKIITSNSDLGFIKPADKPLLFDLRAK